LHERGEEFYRQELREKMKEENVVFLLHPPHLAQDKKARDIFLEIISGSSAPPFFRKEFSDGVGEQFITRMFLKV
jgi:hypothetical protein